MKLFQIVVLAAFIYTLPMESWAQPPRAAPDKAGYALLVDISDYEDESVPPLRWESRDVDKIKEALYSVGGFPEEQIHVLAGEKATREGITELLTTVVESAQAQSNARLLFYIKGRSLRVQDKEHFLPYDARLGAPSTYIQETRLEEWLDQTSFRKALIQATWDINDQGDREFSTQLASILSDEKTDTDDNRNITLAEIEARVRELGFQGNHPVRIVEKGVNVLVRLPSTLEVNSQPSGAIILVDGAEKGITPSSLIGLIPGKHTMLVKKELYRMPAEQQIEIAIARGQRIAAKLYQLTPIKVYGKARAAYGNAITDMEIRIDGTAYRQTVGKDGNFSFETWQAYGLLESGKNYEVIAQSFDGLYEGKTSFTFVGTEDIRLDVSLKQANWIDLATRRLADGDNAGAVSIFDAKIQKLGQKDDGLLDNEALNEVTPALALAFLDHLEDKLQEEPDNLKWRIIAARLAELSGSISEARDHWKAVKANASKDTREYKQAVIRLKQTSPIRQTWVIVLIASSVIAGLAVLGVVGFYVRRWIRFSKFREIPNPYIAGKPIIERGMFFGREDIFGFIKDKFSRSAKDITIVLHGGRRTGKTSIMWQIANGRLGNEFVPVFIDMQELAGVDTHDFFRIIAQKVSEVHRAAVKLTEADREKLDELCRNLEDKSGPAYQSFNDFLANAASTLGGKYIIFLIDEYEILERKVNEGDMTDEIFTYLRHLMQNLNNLAFIFSGSRDFSRRERQEWALMFNMAQPREVSFLSKEDAAALVTEPVKDFVRYSRKAVDRILRLTAGHPFFTQTVCLQIIEDLNDDQENRVTVERVEEACREIVENAPFHLAFLWRELKTDEKIIVSLLAESLPDGLKYASVDDISSKLLDYELEYDRATISKSLARLMEEHLIEKGLDDEVYRFRMDLIRSWIQAEHPTWGVLKEVQDNE